jgi:amidophosphoribosyltransferase
VFSRIFKHFEYDDDHNHEQFCDSEWAKGHLPFAGELYLGHLRYGTFGNDSLDHVHPVMRENNWRSRNLVLAGQL